MDWPSFSIVVPTFQRRDVVSAAVEAIAAIRYAGWLELVVIVDGSADGTVEALSAIDCPFPKKVVWQENAGLARTRNRGAAEAGGDILLFLDDDMICRPDVVERHARSHLAGAEAVLGHIPLDPGSPPGLLSRGVGRWAEERAESLAKGAPITLFDLLGGHLSVRRAVFEAIGGFDETFTAGGTYGNEDIDFGLRLLDRHRVEFNRNAVAGHRYVVGPGQHLRQYYQAGQADVAFARKHPCRGRELFDLHGASLRRVRWFLRPLAAAGLAPLARWTALGLAACDRALPRFCRPVVSRLFFAARDVVYWSGVRSQGGVPASKSVLILCYHAVADLSADPVLAEYGIAPRAFAGQLDRLISRGFTFISPDEFAELLRGRARVPRKAALLTFDDCYVELAAVMRTTLAPRGIAALAFAVSAVPSGTNEWDRQAGAHELRLLDHAAMRELAAEGIEFGAHSRTHRPLTTLSDAELAEEVGGAADDLAAAGVPRPRFFAYPFGMRDARVKLAASDAGYLAGFGLRNARASRASDRFDLPRVEILASDGGWRFWSKTAAPRWVAAMRRARRMIRRPGTVIG